MEKNFTGYFFSGGKMDFEKKNVTTLAILVNNRSGVLMRVVALFSRRGYNIDSLSVGETENPEISRITIVITGDVNIVEQIKHQVGKLIDVINVFEMTRFGSIQRELVLVKLSSSEETRNQIVGLGDIFKAKVVDVTPSTISLELTGSLDKIESFLVLARPYGIVELVRTGITALERGERALSQATEID